MGEIGRRTYRPICRNGILKWSGISQFRFQKVYLRLSGYIAYTLGNLRSVTPKFKKGKDIHPVVDQQFGYVAPLLNLAGSVQSFLERLLLIFVSPIR